MGIRSILKDPLGVSPSPGTEKWTLVGLDWGKIGASLVLVVPTVTAVCNWITQNPQTLESVLGTRTTAVVAAATFVIQLIRMLSMEDKPKT